MLAFAQGLRDRASLFVRLSRWQMYKLIPVALIIFLAAASADPMLPSGGAIVNIPPPTVDWWARVASAIAVVVSAFAFGWTRLDKRRERLDAQEAKEPAVDAVLEQTTSHDVWVLRLVIRNRGDFTIGLDQVSVSDEFLLNTGRGAPPQSVETFDTARAAPGGQIPISASVYRKNANKTSILITVVMTEFRPKAKKLKRVISRDV
jgi:hypothetical protein